jgi:hypothetical protein
MDSPYALVVPLLLTLASTAHAAPSVTVPAAQARIRELGNIQESGNFSFWDNGQLGDYFIAEGPVTLHITASGTPRAGVPPILAVEVFDAAGTHREVARIPVDKPGAAEYTLPLGVSPGVFELRLRHTNRTAKEDNNSLRHLGVRSFTLDGARLSPGSLLAYELLQRPAPESRPPLVSVSTARLHITLCPATGVCSVTHIPTGAAVTGFAPAANLARLPIDFSAYEVQTRQEDREDPALGPCKAIELTYRKSGAPTFVYNLLISTSADELIARLDMANDTARSLTVNWLAPLAFGAVSPGGRLDDWTAICDAKSNGESGSLAAVKDLGELGGWWYGAVKDPRSGAALLMGNLTNNKGLGRVVLARDGSRLQMGLLNDYEGITMPAGAHITGESSLLAFATKGNALLERFGDLIARANAIDLARDHPLDTHTPLGVQLFTTWNSYGSAVIKGFPYKHDATRYSAPYEDPDWIKRCRQKLFDLGLDRFGYISRTPVPLKGAPSPLARRYGQPDFWFKEAQQLQQQHPEFYVDGRVDFSNPAVVEFERQRVASYFKNAAAPVRCGWDFTDRWRRLPGQHDPFLTSAETYRTAVGIWRDAAKASPHGGWAFVYMNVVGINYDRLDVIHIGHDSDQGYFGPGCTFTHGLTRQISLRYFYNGRVWYNNPDSFHVYAGGIYSYQQAKTHASYASISGNVVHLGEPLADEDIPEERLEIARRVAPTTPDFATAVDVFEHSPARLWNLPVRRPFGQWNVVGLFNVDFDNTHQPITQEIRFADLGLDPQREYLVYEFWSRKFLGIVKGSFTRTLQAPDAEVYSIVPAADRPILVSTSRHVRQMAYDLRDMAWDPARKTLRGTSAVVQQDPYELRVWLPEGWRLQRANIVVADGKTPLECETTRDGSLAIVHTVPSSDGDVTWELIFSAP